MRAFLGDIFMFLSSMLTFLGLAEMDFDFSLHPVMGGGRKPGISFLFFFLVVGPSGFLGSNLGLFLLSLSVVVVVAQILKT